MFKPIYSLIWLGIAIGAGASAADFSLSTLPKFQNSFDLGDQTRQSTYYDYMKSTIEPKILALAPQADKLPNEQALAKGQGLAIKLNAHNFNIHVNFPAGAQGGRSYGWTDGKVGDWSDQMYLDYLADVVREKDVNDLHAFYGTLVTLVGECNPGGVSGLLAPTQRVVTNFLAIYTAEEYRAMVPHGISNWDDALFQVTLLGAFHGGQQKLAKFYLGKFSDRSYKQAPGVYKGEVHGTEKDAALDDYWQFSANPQSKRSGVNETRRDFEKMGVAITKYEHDVASNRTLDSIQEVVGKGPNVIEDISRYFTEGKAEVKNIDPLAADVADFLIQVRNDADKITAWELNGER